MNFSCKIQSEMGNLNYIRCYDIKQKNDYGGGIRRLDDVPGVACFALCLILVEIV